MRIATLGALTIAFIVSATDPSASAQKHSSATQNDTLRLVYDIFVGGFHSGHIDLSVRLEDEEYQLFAITSSAGLIDYLVGFRSYAQTRGSIVRNEVRPISHHVNNLWTGDIRFVRMGYVTLRQEFEGPTSTVIHPPPIDDDREFVPEPMRRDTIDPLSAALRAAYSALGRGDRSPCDDSIPVFDGRRAGTISYSRMQVPRQSKGRTSKGSPANASHRSNASSVSRAIPSSLGLKTRNVAKSGSPNS